jgi:hypothetical protein
MSCNFFQNAAVSCIWFSPILSRVTNMTGSVSQGASFCQRLASKGSLQDSQWVPTPNPDQDPGYVVLKGCGSPGLVYHVTFCSKEAFQLHYYHSLALPVSLGHWPQQGGMTRVVPTGSTLIPTSWVLAFSWVWYAAARLWPTEWFLRTPIISSYVTLVRMPCGTLAGAPAGSQVGAWLLCREPSLLKW